MYCKNSTFSVQFLKKEVKCKPINIPGIKKEQLSTEKGFTVKSKWEAKGSRFISFYMMTSLQSIDISGAQGLLMLMGSKFLIKMIRPQNIRQKNNVLRPGHLYQKF